MGISAKTIIIMTDLDSVTAVNASVLNFEDQIKGRMDKYNRRFHLGYPASSIKQWLSQVEQYSMPHFARGVYTAMFGFLLGMGWWAVCASLIISAGWEIVDYYNADGFDFMDIVCEILGATTLIFAFGLVR